MKDHFWKENKNGFGTLTSLNGSKYKGNFLNDKKEGYGKEYVSSLKEYYEGEFSKGIRYGKGTLINSKKQLITGKWSSIGPFKVTKHPDPVSQETYDEKVCKLLEEQDKMKPKVVIFRNKS